MGSAMSEHEEIAGSKPPSGEKDDWDAHWTVYADTAKANPAQIYRRDRICAGLAIPKSGAEARILDIGSGIGCLLEEIRDQAPAAALLGLELSQTGVAIGKRRLPEAYFLQRDLTEPAEIPTEFAGWATHATCSEVLEHVDDPVTLLRNASTYMASGCRLVVTVPGGPRSAYDIHIGHRKHYTPGELKRTLESAGFVVESVGGAGFPMFNLYRLAVWLRGTQLIRDAEGRPGRMMRFVMTAFRLLFLLNLPASPWGWQIVGIARLHRLAAGE